MHAGRLADVHDLAVAGEHEYEAVQSLQQVRAELLHHLNIYLFTDIYLDIYVCIAIDLVARHARLHAPALAQTLGEDLAHLQERGRQPDYARLNEGVEIFFVFFIF